MWNFLTFRRMLFPVIIQLAFWLGTVFFIVFGLLVLAGRSQLPAQLADVPKEINLQIQKEGEGRDVEATLTQRLPVALALIIGGPLLLRLYCELLIVIFRMNSTLTEIKGALKKKG